MEGQWVYDFFEDVSIMQFVYVCVIGIVIDGQQVCGSTENNWASKQLINISGDFLCGKAP